jgi:hypothetical protein
VRDLLALWFVVTSITRHHYTRREIDVRLLSTSICTGVCTNKHVKSYISPMICGADLFVHLKMCSSFFTAVHASM